MRGTRAYLAGFGTSGSLLAGAAMLFVLASAIVAFRGWPQIATGPATTALAVRTGAPPSRTSARLAAMLAHRLAVGEARGSGLIPSRGGAGTGAGASSGAGGSLPVGGRAPGVPVAGVAGGSGGGASTPCSGSSCISSGAQNAISNLTNTVAHEVSTVGTGVGSQVGGTSGAVAGQLSGSSPQVASPVQAAGSTAGGAVSGTATTAANAITGTGTALGGGH